MKKLELLIGLSLLALASGANAGLIMQGDFSIDMQDKIFTAPDDTTVGAGIELDSTTLIPTGSNTSFTGAISIDVSDVDQTINLFVTETFSSGVADFKYINAALTDLLVAGGITAVSIISDTLLSNPTEVVRSLSFTSNSIFLDYTYDCCALIQAGGSVTLSYETASVPEPGTLGLLGLGLLGLVLARKKRSA